MKGLSVAGLVILVGFLFLQGLTLLSPEPTSASNNAPMLTTTPSFTPTPIRPSCTVAPRPLQQTAPMTTQVPLTPTCTPTPSPTASVTPRPCNSLTNHVQITQPPPSPPTSTPTADPCTPNPCTVMTQSQGNGAMTTPPPTCTPTPTKTTGPCTVAPRPLQQTAPMTTQVPLTITPTCTPTPTVHITVTPTTNGTTTPVFTHTIFFPQLKKITDLDLTGTYECVEYEFGMAWRTMVVTLNANGTSMYHDGHTNNTTTGTWSYNSDMGIVNFTGFWWQKGIVEPDKDFRDRVFIPSMNGWVSYFCSPAD